MIKFEVKNIKVDYTLDDRVIQVLDDISFSINKTQSVVIVGPSGCGKTTLIRILAGLEKPEKGMVKLNGKKLFGKPNSKIMLVFQSFALLPWKTVLENVELALLHKKEKDRQKIAIRYIDLVGLDGFEGSYPRELSNGMKQRVGLARALCREPNVLLMDEPFSVLDPLSANNLRNEVLKLAEQKKSSLNVLITVTHNVEEAVIMADRVLVMKQRPSRIIADIPVNLPKPRNRRSEDFNNLVDEITSLITA